MLPSSFITSLYFWAKILRPNAQPLLALGQGQPCFVAVEAQKKTSNLIRLGSSLSSISKPNSWLSPSGLFAFGFYQEKNGFEVGMWIIGHPNNIVVRTANPDYPPMSSNSTIEFTRDGRLILNHT
ncbi:hypothetical protein ACSBR2_011378 [Camellia fascicularis]